MASHKTVRCTMLLSLICLRVNRIHLPATGECNLAHLNQISLYRKLNAAVNKRFELCLFDGFEHIKCEVKNYLFNCELNELIIFSITSTQ